MKEPVTDTTTKPTPILQVAWQRQANLDLAAGRRTSAFYRIRRWITWLSVLATLFAILTQQPLFLRPTLPAAIVAGLVIKGLFVVAPIIASVFAAFAAKYYSNGSWLIYRAGSEEIKKEIYFYRTILQNDKTRRAYLEKRLGEIQRQLFRSLGGEFAFEGYEGKIPVNYSKNDPNSDPGFHDLTGDEYFRYRLQNQLNWHNKKVNQRKLWRRWMTIAILSIGGLGALLAALAARGDSTLALWVALTSSVTAALLGWQELRKVDDTIKNYSKVVLELTILSDHWENLEPEERTEVEFYKLVRASEDVLWAQNVEYVRSMQEALKEYDTEKEASLVNQVIKDSVASAERTKETLRETYIEKSQEFLAQTEQQFNETTQTVLGSLLEEASSEIVQKELEAMGNAITAAAENVMGHVSSFTSSLAQTAQDFAHVEIGRDTSKEELNTILASLPKTNDVKG
jgi:conflict system pore-forming effector with SLATT domain